VRPAHTHAQQQVVNVAAPGQQPALMEAKEDMTPLAGELAGRAGACAAEGAERRVIMLRTQRRV
jgi:hypothetical protein